MRPVAQLWRGDVKLPLVFWLYGVLVLAALNLSAPFVLLQLVRLDAKGLPFLSMLVAVGAASYQFLVSVGLWRSAGRYQGPSIWKYMARAAASLLLVWLGFGIWVAVQQLLVDSHDPTRDSANVKSTLVSNPAYPFTGFWKGSCSENFGLVIEPATESTLYSVSFCGPGGCFKPGTYRPNTSLRGDPRYRVLDNNTIEVEGADGFSRYIRCD